MSGEAGPSSRPNDPAGPSPSTVAAPPLWNIEDLTQREGPDPEKPFGGLNVDGSLAGEAGWAAPPEDYYSPPASGSLPSSSQQQTKKSGLRGIIPRSSRKEEQPAFVACAPREGPATFGQDVVNPAFVASLDAPSASSQASQRNPLLNDMIPLGLLDPSSPNETATLFTEKVDNHSKSGVTLADIVEGRTCRPIALIDLRTWLVTHRETAAAASPPSLVKLELPDLTQDAAAAGSQSIRSRASLSSEAAREKSSYIGSNPVGRVVDEDEASAAAGATKSAEARAAQASYGELDALNFVVAYDRYTRRFRTLTLAQKAQAPRPCDILERSQSAQGGIDRRGSNVVKVGATASAGALALPQLVRRPSSVLSGIASGEPSAPRQQPFRERFNRLIDTYVGPVGSLPTSPTWKANANSLTETTTVTPSHSRRIDWMTELGLIDESLVSQALADAVHTTNPEVLLPLVDAVSRYLDVHVIPDFMTHASKNLSSTTSHGRLSVGIVCTTIALLFSILLAIDPSPMTGTSIPRWYRILTFPFWTAGFGYIIAAQTGVCVWLSLRGNREPGDDGSVSGSGSIYNGHAGYDATGGASARTSLDATWDVNDERVGEEGNLNSVDNSDWLMAPEIRRRLGVVLPVFKETQTPILPVSMPQGPMTMSIASPVSPTDRAAPAVAGNGLSGGNISPTTPFRNPLSPVAEGTSTLAGAPTAKLTAEPVRHDPNASPWAMAGSNVKTAARLKSKTISLPGIEMGMRTVAPSIASTPGSASNLPSSPTSPSSPGYFPGFARRLSSATATPPWTPPAAAAASTTTSGSRRASAPAARGPLSLQIPESSMMPSLAPAMTKTTMSTTGGSAKEDSTTVKPVDTASKDLEAAMPSSTAHQAPVRKPRPSSTRRARRTPSPRSIPSIVWTGVQRWTGFAVATEKVRDERIRKIHLKAAFKALTLDGVLSLIATIIVVAIP